LSRLTQRLNQQDQTFTVYTLPKATSTIFDVILGAVAYEEM